MALIKMIFVYCYWWHNLELFKYCSNCRPDYTFAFTILLKKKTNKPWYIFGITKFYISNYLRDNVKYWDSCGIYLHWKCNSVFAHQIVRQFVHVVRTVKLLHHSSAIPSTQQLSWLSWLLCCFISFLSQNMLGYILVVITV